MTWTTSSSDHEWWRQAVVYQIYPRSFADGNGDGVGDFRGILSRIDYLDSLGIDAVWISPFYPSDLADGGYDVIDYRDVDPRIGSLEDFDRLVEGLHDRGIRVIIDIVPNHTSNNHRWFREAMESGPGSAARLRYHFRDGTGTDGNEPPTDWTSLFGGSAWSRLQDGQWYLHTFAAEQPDLNWSNPEVREEFLDILRFWADRGVDGFRVDAAHMLTKDMSDPLPSQAELDAWPRDGSHPTWDRDELRDIYAQWRAVFNSYDPPRTAVAEAAVHRSRVPMYASPETLGQSFFFDLQLADYDPERFRTIIDECLEVAAASGSSVTWVLNNHDMIRHASRYGTPFPGVNALGEPVRKHGGDWLMAGGDPVLIDAAKGLRRARAASLLLLALPGSAYLYQGEELGLQEVAEIPDSARQDPSFFRNRDVEVGRDGCRVPIPWTQSGPSFGFGDGGAHLPQPLWFGQYSVQAEDGQPESTLTLYRRALELRRALMSDDTLEWIDLGRDSGGGSGHGSRGDSGCGSERDLGHGSGCGSERDLGHGSRYDSVLAFRRANGWTVISNFGTEPVALPEGEIMVASGPVVEALPGESVPAGRTLPGETTVWLRG